MISAGVLVALVAMAICGAAAFAMATEAWLLAHGQPPITSFTRTAILRWPGPSISVGATIVFGIGLLVAHFFWDATCG